MSLKIEVQTVATQLVPVRGETVLAAFYVHPRDTLGVNAESLQWQLNDPEATFLPCEVDGTARLVHLDWIAYLVLDHGEEALSDEPAASRADVELDLVTGKTLAGSLLFHARPGDRASDYLNSTADRFLVLTSEDGDLYVNRHAIEQVRFGSATAGPGGA